jgi:hypothetical protein
MFSKCRPGRLSKSNYTVLVDAAVVLRNSLVGCAVQCVDIGAAVVALGGAYNGLA